MISRSWNKVDTVPLRAPYLRECDDTYPFSAFRRGTHLINKHNQFK